MACRFSQRSLRWAFTAPSALAFVTVLGLAACQSSDDGGDDAERGEDETSEVPREPEAVTTVPERSADADRDESDDADDGAAADADDSESGANESDAPSEGPPETPAAGDTQAPVAAAQTFAACWTNSGPYSDCESIYVTVAQASPGRCIQLTIDNCGTYGRQGLSADAPATWRLAGGSINADADPCELGVYYSSGASVADATGSVSWNETTPRPTELVFDLTLEPSGVSGAEPIALATAEPLQPTECEE